MATTRSARGGKLVDFDLMTVKAALANQPETKTPEIQPEIIEQPNAPDAPNEPKGKKNAKATKE